MDDHSVETGVLDNGLQYVIDEGVVGDIVCITAIVRAGSIYEEGSYGRGVSHFCEHIVHGGTTSERTESEYTDGLDRMGNNSNAATSRNYTYYYITTNTDFWEEALSYIGEWMFDCSFTESEFKREKGVILREIEKSESEPNRLLHRLHSENMFRENPVKYPVLGYRNLFEKVTRDELRNYYSRMYVPENIVISVSGSVSTGNAEQIIEASLGGYERGDGIVVPSISSIRQMGKRVRIESRDVQAVYMEAGYHTVKLDHRDLFALDMLSAVLSRGSTGRIPYALKEERALAASAGAFSYTPVYDGGIFGIWYVSSPDSVREIEKEIQSQIEDIKANGVTEKELKKAGVQEESSRLRDLKTPESRSRHFGMNFLFTGNPLFDRYYIENFKEVTSDQVAEVCRKYLVEDNKTVTYLAPDGWKKPEKKKRKQVIEADTVRTELASGAVLLTRKCGSLPLVNFTVFFKGGTRAEKEEEEGLNSFFAHMLLRGSEDYTRDDIINYFDETGGNIESSGGRNTFSITSEVLKENFQETLNIICSSVLHPVFPEGQVEKLKMLTLQKLKSQEDNWRVQLSKHFRKDFFSEHPYSHNILGNPESVKKFNVKALKNYYSSHVAGKNMVIGIFGDIPDNTVDLVTEALGGELNAEPGRGISPPTVPQITTSKRNVYHTGYGEVAGIYIGFPGVKYTQAGQETVFKVIDAMTSGIGYPGGWLHEKLRGQKLVYVVHAVNVPGMDPGYFGIYAGCDPENVNKAEDVIHQQIGRLEKGDFTEKELEEAKELCQISEALHYQTPGQYSVRETVDEIYGLGYNYYKGYKERIDSVTREDVIKTAKEFFQNSITVVTFPAHSEKGKKNFSK